MEKKEMKRPIHKVLKDEQLDTVTGGFSNEDHTFTMEPGVIKPGTITVEPGITNEDHTFTFTKEPGVIKLGDDHS